jgi:hypothetical protein
MRRATALEMVSGLGEAFGIAGATYRIGTLPRTAKLLMIGRLARPELRPGEQDRLSLFDAYTGARL